MGGPTMGSCRHRRMEFSEWLTTNSADEMRCAGEGSSGAGSWLGSGAGGARRGRRAAVEERDESNGDRG
eukprot:764476-Hanusia_phi.AAC.2